MQAGQLPGDGKTDAGARVFVPCVQSLEDGEDALGVFAVNPDTVVTHCEMPFAIGPLRRHMHARSVAVLELDPVPDEVLEDLSQLDLVGHHRGQLVVGDLGVLLLDGHLKGFKGDLEDVVAVGGFKPLAVRLDAGIGQQCVDEFPHPLGPVGGVELVDRGRLGREVGDLGPR